MTKERKLAIQMWQEIKDKIANNFNFSDIAILRYKEMFCRKYNLDWNCNCWFCQYIPTCKLCPLHDCSVYKVACDSFYDEEARLRACDKIIVALKGEYNL